MDDVATSAELLKFEKQKFYALQLAGKAEHCKSQRLRIASFVAIANFAIMSVLLSTSLSNSVGNLASAIFFFNGIFGLSVLRQYHALYRRAADELEYIFERMGISNNCDYHQGQKSVDTADGVWRSLYLSIIFASIIPTIVVWLPTALIAFNATAS